MKKNQVIIFSFDLLLWAFELLNFFNCRLKLPEDKLSKILTEIYDIIFIIDSNKALHEEAYKIAILKTLSMILLSSLCQQNFNIHYLQQTINFAGLLKQMDMMSSIFQIIGSFFDKRQSI